MTSKFILTYLANGVRARKPRKLFLESFVRFGQFDFRPINLFFCRLFRSQDAQGVTTNSDKKQTPEYNGHYVIPIHNSKVAQPC